MYFLALSQAPPPAVIDTATNKPVIITHQPTELSGGQQQRVAIARALVQNPAFILADEPTGNLDKESGMNILNILKELNKQGKTVVMITHNQEHAKKFKKVITLTDGKIVA